jgi:hypothetical protein
MSKAQARNVDARQQALAVSEWRRERRKHRFRDALLSGNSRLRRAPRAWALDPLSRPTRTSYEKIRDSETYPSSSSSLGANMDSEDERQVARSGGDRSNRRGEHHVALATPQRP